MRTSILFLTVFIAITTTAAELPLVRDGKALCSIVIPAETSETVRFAAQELQLYLKKISDVEVPIKAVASVPEGAAIVIAKTGELNVEKSVGSGELGEESFLVKASGDRIFISAKSDRGLLYGVYSFLEKELGVRWFAPGPDGEVVPRSKDVVVSVADRLESPSFRYRYLTAINYGKGDWGRAIAEWAVRNRLNVNLSGDEEFLRKRGGMLTEMSTHSWSRLVPTSRYFAEHPEWFALIGGKRRDNGKWTKLCTTNPEVVRFIAQKAIEYFREHPDYELFSVTQSDGLGWCECPNCTALDSGAKWLSTSGKLYPVVTDRMVKFANDVAEIVSREFPDKYLYFLACHSTFEPPVRFKPHKNLMIQVVHSRPNYEYFNKPLTSGGEKHVKFRAGLEKWLSYGNPITIYDYTPHSTFMQLPFSAARKFAADVRYLKDAGVCGYLGQSVGTIWGVYGLNYYVLARCFWDAHLDIDKLLDDYFSKFYGEAGGAMARFFKVLEDGLVNHEGMSNGIDDYLNDDILIAARACIEEAKSLAKSDLIRRRIEPHEIMLHYGELFYEGKKLEKRYRESGSIEDLRAALAAYRKAADYEKEKADTHALARISKLDTVLIPRLEAELKRLEASKQEAR